MSPYRYVLRCLSVDITRIDQACLHVDMMSLSGQILWIAHDRDRDLLASIALPLSRCRHNPIRQAQGHNLLIRSFPDFLAGHAMRPQPL
jgi:hypothetical protein